MNRPRHLVLLIGDSLRWDSVHAKGSPQLPYVERNAVSFAQARSAGCWTLPATASMFSGLMPHEHGATAQTRGIRREVTTLAERMKGLGYRTHMVTANVATTEVFGLDRGFDSVDRIWHLVPPQYKKIHQVLVLMGKPRLREKIFSSDFVMGKLSEDIEAGKTWLQTTLDAIFDRARALLAEREKAGEGAFLFLNLMEGHFPYHVNETFEFLSRRLHEKLLEMYYLYHLLNQTWLTQDGAEIPPQWLAVLRDRQRQSWQIMRSRVDAFIRELREAHGAFVAFGSDHGDAFGEQGWQYHFSNVTDAGNRVPLFVLPHDRSEARVETRPVSARDLFGTFLRAAGDPDSSLVSLLENPDRSLPVMQSYWYNNRGLTLEKYRFNQFGFVYDGRRYAHRGDHWVGAPITFDLEREPAFQRLGAGVDPIAEGVDDRMTALRLRQAFEAYQVFSQKIMARGTLQLHGSTHKPAPLPATPVAPRPVLAETEQRAAL